MGRGESLAEMDKAFIRGRLRVGAADAALAGAVGALMMVASPGAAADVLPVALALVVATGVAGYLGRAPGRVALPALVTSGLPLLASIIHRFAPMTDGMLIALLAAVGFFIGRTLAVLIQSQEGKVLGLFAGAFIASLPALGLFSWMVALGQSSGTFLGYVLRTLWFRVEHD